MKAKVFLLIVLLLLQSTLAGRAQNVFQDLQQAVPRPPVDPSRIFGTAGGAQPPGNGAVPQVPACNIQWPPLPNAEDIAKHVIVPKAEDIAKLVTIPTDDIAKKVAELHNAPFEALGKALGEKIKDGLKAQSDSRGTGHGRKSGQPYGSSQCLPHSLPR